MTKTPVQAIYALPWVQITRLPLVAALSYVNIPENTPLFTAQNSWAVNFGGKGGIHGIVFSKSAISYFSPTYGSISADTLLAELKMKFPGVDGITDQPEFPPCLPTHWILWECWYEVSKPSCESLIQPLASYHTQNHDMIRFIADFVHLASRIEEDLLCVIKYEHKMEDPHQKSATEVTIPLQIHFCLRLKNPVHYPLPAGEEQLLKRIEHSLKPLFRAYHNPVDQTTYTPHIQRITPDLLPKIMWDDLWTHPGLHKIMFRLNSHEFDFSFPNEITLPRAIVCPNERFDMIAKDPDPTKILDLGIKLTYGVPTTMHGTFHIDKLTSHVGVFGKPGCGKTTVILSIIKEIIQKCPGIGILIINFAKHGQASLYAPYVDIIIEYKSSICQIPYFCDVSSKNTRTSRKFSNISTTYIQRVAKAIAAGLRMGSPMDTIIKNVLQEAINTPEGLPSTLHELFLLVDRYLTTHRYSPEYQADLSTAFHNRTEALIDSIFTEVTRYSEGTLPEWVQWWLAGKSIFLDLSDCVDEVAQRFLNISLLNLINYVTTDLEHPQAANCLKYLIVQDEAHRAFSRLNSSDPYSDEMKAANLLDKLIHDALSEFRSRGVGLIFADQTPADLISAITQIPSLFLLFRLAPDQVQPFCHDSRVQDILDTIESYTCYVLNDASYERYLLRTMFPSEIQRTIFPPPAASHWWWYQRIVYDPTVVDPIIGSQEISTALEKVIPAELTLVDNRFQNAANLVYALGVNRLLILLHTLHYDYCVENGNDRLFSIIFSNPEFTRLLDDPLTVRLPADLDLSADLSHHIPEAKISSNSTHRFLSIPLAIFLIQCIKLIHPNESIAFSNILGIITFARLGLNHIIAKLSRSILKRDVVSRGSTKASTTALPSSASHTS